MGLVYIALSVVCSLAIAHFLKQAKKSRVRLVQVLTVNYLAAALISSIVAEESLSGFTGISPYLLLVAVILGILFITNFFIYSHSLSKIGMGISITAMRMSLVIPIGVSLILYGEHIQAIRYAGILLVFTSLYLLIPPVRTKNISRISDAIFPLLLFVFSGVADASMEVYERRFMSQLSEYGFLSIIFASAFLAGLGILVFQNDLRLRKQEIIYGLIIGVTNLYSSFFLIYALQEMSGSLVFSLVNILNVVIGSLIGFFIWKDSLNKKQRAGIVLAVIAIILLII